MTNVADDASRPVVPAPIRLRIIGWFWIAMGVTSVVPDFCSWWFLGNRVVLNLAWFVPILGIGLLSYEYFISSIARGVTWLVVFVLMIASLSLVIYCLLFTVFEFDQVGGEERTKLLGSAALSCALLAFFAWQLKVLYDPSVKSLTVRGPSKYRPRPSRRVDLLSLFFFVALCAMTMAPLTMLRGRDPTEPGDGFSTVTTDGNQESVFTTSGVTGLFGWKEYGRAFLATEVRVVSRSSSGIVVLKLLDGSQEKIETNQFGIVIHNGERLETSRQRVPGSVFMKWAKSRRQSEEGGEASLKALFDFIEKTDQESASGGPSK